MAEAGQEGDRTAEVGRRVGLGTEFFGASTSALAPSPT